MADNTITTQYKKKSQLVDIFRRLFKNKAAVIGFIIVIILVGAAIFAPLIYNYNEVVIKADFGSRLQWPSASHLLGTDELGRDILSRIVYGSRVSLSISCTAVFFSLLGGLVFGSIAGFFGGKTDMIIMRVMDVFLAIPGTLLAITIAAALKPSTGNLILALTISTIPTFSRIVRGSVLTVRDVEFVEAARAIGAKNGTIIVSHILPNAFAPIMVHTTLSIASLILTTAGLSFLGLGIQAPQPEWGAMLSGGRTFIRDYSYMTLFPGLAIMTTILAFNLLGDGLRDALDPRLK